MASTGSRIAVRQLLSACVHLVRRANRVIRDVAQSGNLQAVEKAEGVAVLSKGAAFEDPQTIADRRSQLLIVGSLRKAWPNLSIVGEESDGCLATASDPDDLIQAPNQSEPEIEAQPVDPAIETLEASGVCIFVDPLDATLEFTKGVYDAVTVLVGITYRGRPIAGVVGFPFVTAEAPNVGRLDSPGHVVWGCLGAGVHGVLASGGGPAPAPKESGLCVCVTASHPSAALEKALQAVQPANVLRVGGCGKKIMMVVRGECDAYITIGPGTKRWDTAAPEALLRALGGGVTNTRGEPYHYEHAAHDQLHNRDGLLASVSPAVLQSLAATLTRS